MHDEFERLERLITRLQAQPPHGQPVTGAGRDANLDPLVQAATAVRQLADVSPSPARVARIRATLRTGDQATRSTSFWGGPVRRAGLAIALLAVLVAGSATVSASGDAFPDSPLYHVRNLSEQAQLAWAQSPSQRTTLSLDFALVRARQLHQIALKGSSIAPDPLDTLLKDIVSLVARAGSESQADGTTARQTMQRKRRQIAQELLDTEQQGRFAESEGRALTQTIAAVEKVEPVEVEGSDG